MMKIIGILKRKVYGFHKMYIESHAGNEEEAREEINEMIQIPESKPFDGKGGQILNDAQILIDQVKLLGNTKDNNNNNLMINKSCNDSNKNGSQYDDQLLVFEFSGRTKLDKELTDIEEEEDEGDDNNPGSDQIADIIK